MRNYRLLVVLLAGLVVTSAQAQVGSYFSKFRPSKKWSVGLQIGPSMLNGDADDYAFGLSYGLHAKYSLGQSFGLKLSGNLGTLNGGRENPAFSNNVKDGANGATSVDQQNPDDKLFNDGSSAAKGDSYVFTNKYKDIDVTAVYTLGNLSFLRPLRTLQLFTFFGVGTIWSEVDGHYENTEDARHEFAAWGPSYFTPVDANDNVIATDPNDPSTWSLDGQIADAKTYYKGRNLTIPFGAGVKRNFGQWLDLGLEFKSHWTRNDQLDAYSFPTWRNRVWDYYSTLSLQASIKLGAKGQASHYDWLNPMETIYADMDSMKNNIERMKPLLEDADGDGVSDYYDAEDSTDCDRVYGNGRAVDSDGDGISDCKDAQPFSECDEVDENGVAIDSDNDGVPDCRDEESNTPDGSLVDVRGVGIDINENCCDCENVVLPSIIFDDGSSKISSSNYGILWAIAEKMKQCPELTLTALGYSNSKSSEQLSWKRANAIIDHLEANYGIDRSRVTVDYSSDSSGDYSRRRIDLNQGSTGNSAPPAPGM